jgi:hypothetical protein
MAHAYRDYVVIGAGKTGMDARGADSTDARVWLIENRADPDRIPWIMPRDYWLLDRAGVQQGKEFLAALARSVADHAEALAKGRSVDDVFARLEACGVVKRIDAAVKPTAYHCAVIGQAELELLRRIRDIVRLGRVTRIDSDPPTSPRSLTGSETATPFFSAMTGAPRSSGTRRLLYPESVAGVAGLSVPYVPRGEISFIKRARSIYAGRFFYQLYFQEEGWRKPNSSPTSRRPCESCFSQLPATLRPTRCSR